MSKPGLDIILGLGKPKPGKEPDEGEPEDLGNADEDAAAELLQAIEDKDPKALAEAFATLMKLCDKDEPAEEE